MLWFVFEFPELLFLCSWGICIINSQAVPLCASPYLLQRFHCNWLLALYSIFFMRIYCMYACICVIVLHDRVWLRADRTYNSFSLIHYCWRSQVIVHYVYIAFMRRHVFAFLYCLYIAAENNKHWIYFIKHALVCPVILAQILDLLKRYFQSVPEWFNYFIGY